MTYIHYQGEGHGGETWQKYELWAGMQVAVWTCTYKRAKAEATLAMGDNK